MINCIYIAVSVLSIFFYVMSVQFKEKRNILIVQILASLCYLTVYIIKGAWSGVAIEILEELKNLVFIKMEKKNKEIPKSILYIFLGLLLIVSFIFYDGIYSLLPLIINVILFVATYKQNPKHIRYSMLICGILWGCYNVCLGAYIILIGNVLEVFSAIISIYRYRNIDNKK